MTNNVVHSLLKHQTGILNSGQYRDGLSWFRINGLGPSKFRQVKVTQGEDNEEEREEETERGHLAAITSLDLESQEARYLLAGCIDGSLYIHDLANLNGCPKTTSRMIAHIKPVREVEERIYHPPTASRYRRSSRPPPVAKVHGHKQGVQTVQWFPGDSAIFVTSGMDQRLLVWDANSMEVAEEFNINKLIYCHQISLPPSPMIAIGSSSNHVRLIDLKSGSNTHELRGHADSVVVVRWSEKQEFLLASGCLAGQVLLWDVRRAKSCLQTLDLDYISKSSKPRSANCCKAHCGPASGLAFCDDGIHLISFGAQEGKLRRWDLNSGRNTKTPFSKLHRKSKSKTTTRMSLSPSYGRSSGIIFVPEGSNVAALDVKSGILLRHFRGHYNGVNCTAINQQFHELYTGGGDKNILIWDSNEEQSSAYDDHLKETGGGDDEADFTNVIYSSDDD